MKVRATFLATILALSLAVLPSVYAEPTVEIIMERTTYSYCEKLFYTIKVSEVTGNPAIIHIIDETGKGSSAIPIPINELENPVPSRMAFEKDCQKIADLDHEQKMEKPRKTANRFNPVEKKKETRKSLIPNRKSFLQAKC